MGNFFSDSKCFVSTQDFENFTSLAMLEAMACGNAVVARNVGQTNFFVKDGVNGILAKEDSAKGIAEALKFYIEHPEKHEAMKTESIRIAREENTAEKFIQHLDSFWKKIYEK